LGNDSKEDSWRDSNDNDVRISLRNPIDHLSESDLDQELQNIRDDDKKDSFVQTSKIGNLQSQPVKCVLKDVLMKIDKKKKENIRKLEDCAGRIGTF
jgi:hypothetical protein